jgi:hypothetical protein
MEKLSKKPATIINQNTTTTNNTTHNNTTHNTINLIPYGHHRMDRLYMELTVEDFKSYITGKDEGVCKLIEDKYFNQKYPEYQNITTNPTKYRNGQIMVYKDDKWVIRDRNTVLEEILDNEIGFIISCCSNEKIELSKEKLNRYARYFDSLDVTDKSLQKKAGIVILNNCT